MSEWQDISTAPEDGTKVDVWAYGERWADASFTVPDHHPRQGRKPPDACWCSFEQVDYDGIEGWDPIGPEVTHWMPIPAGPK